MNMENSFPIQDCAQDEQRLLLSAIRDSTDKDKWESFLKFNEFALSGLVLHGTLQHDNEQNIRYVVDLILKNEWEQGEWDNENIFSEDFFEICKTPICLPVTYMGFLSGEFILYLLHPNQIEFYRKDEKDIASRSSDDNKTIYQQQYNRYFGAKPKEEKNSYASQFEEAFEISLRNLKPMLGNNIPNSRKSTKLWLLFELYSYLVKYFPKSKNENDTKLITMVHKPHEDLFWKGMMNALEDAEKRLLFFATVIFQWLSDEDKGKISYYQELMRLNQAIERRVFHDIKTLMIALSLIDASQVSDVSNNSAQKAYIKARDFWDNLLDEKESSIREKIDNGFGNHVFREIVKVENSNMYFIILWHILSIQHQNEIKYVINTDTLPIECNYKDIKTALKTLSKSEPILVEDESSFLDKYSKEMKMFFPRKTTDELIQMLRVSIRVLVFCNHEKLKFNYMYYKNGIIKRNPPFQWFVENGIPIGTLQLNEVITCMQLLEPAKLIKVEVYGKNTKKYLIIADSSSKQHSNITLNTVMTNIRKHASEPLLKQLSEWISRQNIGNISTRENVSFYRRLQNFSILNSQVSAYNARSMEEEIATYDDTVEWVCNQMNRFATMLPIRWPPMYGSATTVRKIRQSI